MLARVGDLVHCKLDGCPCTWRVWGVYDKFITVTIETKCHPSHKWDDAPSYSMRHAEYDVLDMLAEALAEAFK